MNQQSHLDQVRLLPWRIPERIVDTVLLAVLICGFIARSARGEGSLEASEWVALAIAAALLLLRRRYPLPTLALAVAAAAGVVAATDRPNLLLPVALVMLFNVAQRFDWRTTIVAGAATTACFLLIVTVALQESAVGGAALASIAWPAFAATAGAAIRSTRESVTAAEQRALRAEESRELEAKRRVIEERLRVARDVHDLVAHHIAVINVQSSVAGHFMQSDPAAAGEALDVVRGAAATVIDQLGELLSVLRSPDEVGEPTSPTPDLTAIDDLVASFASSGLAVRTETSGVSRPLSGLAELTAYRVVQEALTNAHKHGDGTATLALRFNDAGLQIAIANPTSGVDSSGSGFGLIGMRERVEGLGGTLKAGRAGSGHKFEVSATIPAKDNE